MRLSSPGIRQHSGRGGTPSCRSGCAFAPLSPDGYRVTFTGEASAALCPFHKGSDVAFGHQVIDPVHGILTLRPTNLACCLDHDGKEASQFDCSGSTHQLLSQLPLGCF